MIIGEIGNHFANTEKIKYNSERSFLDFDLLIIDMIFFFEGPNLLQKKIYDKRKEDLAEFLYHKKVPLIIIAPDPKEIVFMENGQNKNFSLCSLLPIPPFDVKKESGRQLIVLPNNLFSPFLLEYKQYFSYESYFVTYTGKVLIETPHAKRVVSFYNESSVFLPRIPGINVQIQEKILIELYSLAKQVQRNDSEIKLPEWANNYYLPSEKETIIEINKINNQINLLSNDLNLKKEKLLEYKRRKSLFVGTGDELEFEVEKVFEEIGFDILQVEPGRDDLIIKYKDNIAVVEIKGVSTSAAEKHAAQLEKWVANYYEINEIKPKGILIVNSYRDIELLNRNEMKFPNQMLKFSQQREHCLITTLQLLGLFYKIKENPGEKDELIKSLFETVGVYTQFDDWQNYISYDEQKNLDTLK